MLNLKQKCIYLFIRHNSPQNRMYQHIYKVPVRSEWSEFSLRTRPPKIRRFQAGFSNTSDDEDIASLRRKTERNLRQTKPVLRNENTVEDSIEYDVCKLKTFFR